MFPPRGDGASVPCSVVSLAPPLQASTVRGRGAPSPLSRGPVGCARLGGHPPLPGPPVGLVLPGQQPVAAVQQGDGPPWVVGPLLRAQVQRGLDPRLLAAPAVDL